MTIDEKIAHLQAAAMEDARAEGNTIIKKHLDTLENLFEEHKSEAIRQADTRIKAETVNAKQQLNMATSKAQIELKRELSQTQNQLKAKLFDEVKALLNEYMQSEEYTQLLILYINKAAHFANGEELTIYINPTDEHIKACLEEYTGMTVTISREDFVGGMRAVVHGRNILIDHSFKGALEAEYDRFVFEGGAGIE